jgi:hypothetical protein
MKFLKVPKVERFLALSGKEFQSLAADIVKIKQNSYNFRYNNTADIPRPRTTRYGKKSFSYEAARLWNSLPDKARNLSTFGTFKNFISTWCFSENCFCSSCRT